MAELISKLASENRSWGYTRIQGASANLRHQVGRGTLEKVTTTDKVISHL